MTPLRKHFLNVKRVFAVAALWLGSILGCFAQIDTEFWFAAPDITAGHGHTPILLCFASFGQPADVTVSQPANPLFQPITVHLNSFDFHSIDLTSFESILETAPENTVTNYGLKVISTSKIATYYQLCDPNSEIYTLKGRNALGTHFIVPMQNTVQLGYYYPEPRSSIEIVATQDNTTVTIIPGNAISGSNADTIVVVLNAGQTYSIRSVGISAADHLGNTVIISDNPIAVNSTDDSVYHSGTGAADLSADQIVPIDYAGNLFVSIWAEQIYDYETATIFPTQDNTQIFIDGSTIPVATINIGQQYVYHHSVNMSAPITMIRTDKPVLVWQLSGYQSEMGATLLPALECTGSREVVYGRSNYSTTIVAYIITETVNISDFSVQCSNSSATLTAADFTPVPYDTTWSYCLKDFSSDVNNGSVLRVSNFSGKFHLGVLDYGGGTTSLGYFCAYNNGGRIVFTQDEGQCLHSEVDLTYFADEVDSIQFVTPSGSVLNQSTLTINNFTAADTGMYYIHALSTLGCDSIAWISDSIRLYLLPCEEAPLPDNVDSADCTVPSIGHDWGIGLDWSAVEMVSPLVIPLVGDINGDKVPEIVCLAPNDNYNYYGSTQIMIFNTLTHQLIHTINLPERVSTNDAAPYGIIKLPNEHVILVVALINQTLHAYDLTAMGTTPLWSTNTDSYGPNVSFADFNSDSYPEIYIGNKIYDAETGTLLISDPTITNTASSYAHHNETPFGHTPSSLSSPCVADLVGDYKPDLILGNEIYEVLITNRNGLAGNNISLSKSITPPSGISVDGHPQVADFNLDGHLDVFVSKKDTTTSNVGCYVWDVHNNTVSNALIIPANESGKSIPLIADVDNDNTLEIVIQCRALSGNAVKCYKFDTLSNSFTLMWDIYVDEDSYSNSMSVFDFNNDGNNDLLISDQTTVRIVNGSGHSHLTGNDTISVYTLTSLSFGECTVMQYPLVADVDADGSAELVVLGRFGSGHTYQAFLNVFKSTSLPWAPARKVWNQYMYNVTNVNEDLTVPLHLFNNATPFTDPQGVVRRPYNNFLQQATTIDQYGRPFYAVPDVVMDTSTSSQMVGDSLVLTFSYCNLGDNMLNAPYPITVFANTYGGDSLGTIIMSSNLPVDSCTQGEIHLAASDLCSLQGLNTLVVAVNCAGNGIAQNGGLQPECDTNNNTTNVTVDFLSVSVVMTEQACDSYTWNGTTYNTSGSYTASYTNEYGCDSIVTLQLTINPSVEIEDNLTLCENQLPYTYGDTVFAPGTSSSATFVLHRFTSAGCDSIVTLHLTINPTGLTEYYDSVCQNTAYSGYGFSLSEGETNTTGSHIFDHILTNQFGCDSIIRLHLYVKPVITPDFYADPDRAMLSESPMIHFVNNTNTVEIAQANYYWLWDFGDGTTDSTAEAETEHLYTQWGDYTVTLTLWADGCVDSSSVTVFIEADLEFPNVITPNGDGINDVFIIKNLNPDRPNKLYISDRWGKVVWNKDNYQTYMKDGQIYNAESGFGIGDLSDGVYYYAFYYEGVVRTIKFNGSITVIK